MRIAILTHNFPKNSSDRQDAGILIYDFAVELSKKAEVFVLCPNFAGEKEKFKDITVEWFSWKGGDKKLGSINTLDPRSLMSLASLISNGRKITKDFVKRNNIDFCLAAWAFPAGLFAEVAKDSLKVPYATWSLGSDINQYAKKPILKQIIKKTLRKADFRFANSYALCQKIEDLTCLESNFLPGITRLDAHKITKIKTDKNKFNFLYVGRLEMVKGPDVMIDACKILAKKNKNFTLSIIGPGSMTDTLKQEIKDSNLDKNVFFLGQKGASEIASYMSVHDSLIVPSRSESLPLVIIEAAKMGLPIIATKVGDCARLIDTYEVGIAVDSANPEALSKAMDTAIKEGSNFKKKAQPGLKKISADFILENSVKQFLKYIQK
jgi:glycosyltransferase involved in cell wall biosynthesis